MTLQEIEEAKMQEQLQKIENTLNSTTWGMSVAQLAQTARLSIKTVHKLLKDNSNRFDESDGVYTLRGVAKPPTQSVSIPGIVESKPHIFTEVSEVLLKPETQTISVPEVPHFIAKPANPDVLTSIMGISFEPEQAIATDESICRDKSFLDEMLKAIKSRPSGILSRDLMMIMNLRRDQVYHYADILLSQGKIHKSDRSNRQIIYKYGPAPEPTVNPDDFLSKVKTVNLQKRSVTLTQVEVEKLLLKMFGMDEVKTTRFTNGLVYQLTAELEF